jgi:pantetheine-phosphate adenylyltransferase
MKKSIAIYPGTFDPITNGHLDIIERASVIFDKIIVAIALNTNKSPLFTKDERKNMINVVTKKFRNIEVDSFDGLLVDYTIKKKAIAIIRGLRAVSDFEYEFQMSLTNRKLAPSVNTIFLMPNEKYTYLNSSLVKELARFNGKIDCFVPDYVRKKLEEKYR